MRSKNLLQIIGAGCDFVMKLTGKFICMFRYLFI